MDPANGLTGDGSSGRLCDPGPNVDAKTFAIQSHRTKNGEPRTVSSETVPVRV